MPANPLSFHVTDAYRAQIEGLHQTADAVALAVWNRIDLTDLDGSYSVGALAANLAALQLQTARASRGYLTAFLTSELGSPNEVPPEGSSASIGLSRDGRLLAEAFYSPLIAVKATLKAGGDSGRALDDGLKRLKLMAGLELDHVADLTLLTAIDRDERFDGWQRAVRGTCGMCLGAATGPDGGLRFPRHPNCKCVSEPRVSGIRHIFKRPTGAEIFDAMTEAEQDASIGPKAAEAVRAGLPLSSLIASSPQAVGEDFAYQGAVPQAWRRYQPV